MAANYACLPAWRAACAEALGCEIRTLRLRAGSGAGLGLFHYAFLNSRLFGRRIISLPFSDESGIELKPGADPAEAGRAILAGLDAIARETRAASAELRGQSPALEALGGALSRSEPYVRFLLDLSPGYPAVAARYHSNLAKNLAQGARRLEVQLIKEPKTGTLRRLYLIYLAQMRSFGSPPLPMSYFSAMAGSGLYVFFEARLQGRSAGMLAAIPDGDALRADVNASLPEFAASFPKVRLFDESVRWACAEGFKTYDLMRTRRGTGVYDHKAKWGGAERPVVYYRRAYSAAARTEPDPQGAVYRLGALGLRLLPLALLERLGPVIRAGAGK